MAANFFTAQRTQNLMREYMKAIEHHDAADNFEKLRNNNIKSIFILFLKDPEQWDEKAEFNIKNIGDAFINELENQDLTKESINLIFTCCFRFCVEPTIFTEMLDSPGNPIKLIKDFGIYRYHEFDENTKSQLDYALREMPLNIVRDTFKSDDISSFKDFLKNLKSAKEFAGTWEEYIENQKTQINEIKSKLDGYNSAFNFVGLYDGFKLLGEKKNNEIFWSRLLLTLLAIAIPCPLLIEYFATTITNTATGLVEKLTSFIPLFSLTLILIYYFRVALTNHTSLKAQILQIELRKSLCQFIQSYSDYSRKIKDNTPDLLVKFEEVIFSNIMPNQEKIPSTFDGVEQIASLISSIKPK
ncbi:hypothetical protein ACSLOU_09865 [Enterobacter cloacae]|uniref:hypothetical protein n=1 Tax=Enterobacter cloacae TaxID=550 RepID=UPI003EE3C1F4